MKDNINEEEMKWLGLGDPEAPGDERFDVFINYGTHSELYGTNLEFNEAINLAFDWEREELRPQDQEFPYAHVQRMKETSVAA